MYATEIDLKRNIREVRGDIRELVSEFSSHIQDVKDDNKKTRTTLEMLLEDISTIKERLDKLENA